MHSRKILLKKSLLYLIVDKPGFSGLVPCGVGIFQLRDKSSSKARLLSSAIRLVKFLRNSGSLFIVNDHIDVAVLSGADGVHLGQGDLPLEEVRMLLGKDKVIGISCHNLSQALKAQEKGADYIGIGPIYPTATKPGCRPVGLKVLRRLKGKIKIPYFAIGGIGEKNINEVLAAGARRIAVSRSVLKAKDPAGAARRLYSKLKDILN